MMHSSALKNTIYLKDLSRILGYLRVAQEQYDQLTPGHRKTIDLHVSTLWNDMSDVKNAAGYPHKVWHGIVVLAKQLAELFMALLGKKVEYDKTYSGPIRSDFWKEDTTRNWQKTQEEPQSCPAEVVLCAR